MGVMKSQTIKEVQIFPNFLDLKLVDRLEIAFPFHKNGDSYFFTRNNVIHLLLCDIAFSPKPKAKS